MRRVLRRGPPPRSRPGRAGWACGHPEAGRFRPLLDSARPYRIAFRAASTFDHLILRIPRDQLDARAPHLHRATALSVKAASAAGRLAFPILTTLASDDGAAPFVGSILDLLGTALGEAAGLTGLPLSRGQRTLEQITHYSLARLATPDLSPATVAQACFVSSRQLHRLFEREGTTFGAFVKEARLARIQRDLTDPAMASLTIAEIGHRHGYRQPAVLTRAFTQRYGAGPRELRRSRHQSPEVRHAAASVSGTDSARGGRIPPPL
jgi:AraC-like DNA-binding protein